MQCVAQMPIQNARFVTSTSTTMLLVERTKEKLFLRVTWRLSVWIGKGWFPTHKHKKGGLDETVSSKNEEEQRSHWQIQSRQRRLTFFLDACLFDFICLFVCLFVCLCALILFSSCSFSILAVLSWTSLFRTSHPVWKKLFGGKNGRCSYNYVCGCRISNLAGTMTYYVIVSTILLIL